MKICSNLEDINSFIREAKKESKISFVPTMGYLHEGHLSLIRLAREKGDILVSSIFVNPLQFNVAEDLEKYPRDLERDSRMLKEESVDLLFTPNTEDLFANFSKELDYQPSFSDNFEAKFRDGHFKGVCTIVKILFDIIKPDYAVFGEKDFQQLRILEKMVEEFDIPVEIIRAPLVRDSDGLALSSRNVRLSTEARKSALSLSRGLFAAKKAIESGMVEVEEVREVVREEMEKEASVRLEYLDIIDEQTFLSTPLINQNSRIILAAHVGGVRLIDNYSLR